MRLIGADGEQLGIMPSKEAFKIATAKSLDLVKIAPTAAPPVCRIMDYGKFRFEQAKKEKEARRNQHIVEIKEVRLSPGIDVHDFNVKLRNAQKFLEEGDKVKVSMRFRGREMAHASLGEQLMRSFAEKCAEISSLEKPPKLEGRHMIMFLASKCVPKAGHPENGSGAKPQSGVKSAEDSKPDEAANAGEPAKS